MKGRRRNGFFKTVDDSKIHSNLRARLKLSKIDHYRPEKTSKEKGASNNFALTQVEKQAENKRKTS